MTDCVLSELEKLGQKYRVALRFASSFSNHRIRSYFIPLEWPVILDLSVLTARIQGRMRTTASSIASPPTAAISSLPATVTSVAAYEKYRAYRSCTL